MLTAGITLDAPTTRLLVRSTFVLLYSSATKGIDILGSNNTIVANNVTGSHVAAISIGPGASDNVVVNNYVSSGRGRGIHNTSATGTAITNNTVQWTCGTGIRVDGNSSGVSVQNNEATSNNPGSDPGCDPSITGEVIIGVYDDATNGTVVDYNRVYNGGFSRTHGTSRWGWRRSRPPPGKPRTISIALMHT
jgi:parallel beta-helix repeat protein